MSILQSGGPRVFYTLASIFLVLVVWYGLNKISTGYSDSLDAALVFIQVMSVIQVNIVQFRSTNVG